ncbi:hypothetical protein A6C57_13585 [Fibrella sp. ES10-3-2-2]|nr:hypothetical protein A6C57_13585 [Fibrella sp. ES10-3-2-2]
MKKLLIVALLAVSATCQNQASVQAEFPVQETNAVIIGDQLPVDGCAAHIVLNNTTSSSDSRPFMRLPTEATRLLMDNVIKAEVAKQPTATLWMGSKEVTIRYRETGKTAVLTCGWGARQEVKTIDLLEVKVR